jgi:hypothetical protein
MFLSQAACYLLHAGFLLCLFFDSEDGGNIRLKYQLSFSGLQCYIPEDRTVYKNCGENLRSYIHVIKWFSRSIYFNCDPHQVQFLGGGGGGKFLDLVQYVHSNQKKKNAGYFILTLKSSDQNMSSQMSVSIVVDYNYRQYLPGIESITVLCLTQNRHLSASISN